MKALITQISILLIIQWLSIAVIILNALSSHTSWKELIMGASSLLAASLLLLISIHQFFNGFRHNKSLLPSKTILGLQIMLPVIIISVWITTSIILSTHFNGLLSKKKKKKHIFIICALIESLLCRSDLSRDRNSCTFVDTMIVIGMLSFAIYIFLTRA